MLINDLKRPFLENEDRGHEIYRMLKIMEYLIDTLEDYESNGSEMTSYRRFAYIFDILFRKTAIKCLDGEIASDTTKGVKLYNEAITNTTFTDTRGKKIDLLVKYGSSDGVELSSNEFKVARPSPLIALQQQCKNLRTNAAILNNLQALDSSDQLATL